MRAAAADNTENVVPARKLPLEQSLEFCRADKCFEVTPETVRIRQVSWTRRSPAAPARAPSADAVRAPERGVPGLQRLADSPTGTGTGNFPFRLGSSDVSGG